MSTNVVKWKDSDDKLTAFCDDDSADTEIGPAKWDDANNKLEINCDSTDFQVKWNDTDNRLEARNVSVDCCCEFTNNCTDCYSANQTPAYMKVSFINVDSCVNGCDWVDGDFILPSTGNCFWNVSGIYHDGEYTRFINLYLRWADSGSYYTRVWAGLYKPTVWYSCFINALTTPSCDDNEILNNSLSSACPTYTIGYNGTATISVSCTGV